MRIRAGAVVAASLLCAGVIPLRATTIVSYTVSNWESTETGTKDANFNQIQYITYGPSGYTSSDGFNITGPDGSTTYLEGLEYKAAKSLEGGTDSSAEVEVATPSGGETALLFVLGSNPSASSYTITLSDGETWTVSGSTTIFGVSVSHPITTAILSATTGSNLILEDVSYGNTTLTLDSGGSGGGQSTVPEATTALLLGAGLVMVAVAGKRVSPL
ncbi:MAG: hypothetical protein WB676_13470 [Bryobacteraceae bacterium]